MIEHLTPNLQFELDHFCERLGCSPEKNTGTQNLRDIDTQTLLTLFIEGIDLFQRILDARDREIKKEARLDLR
jgi:hypothetical protein